LPNKNQDHALLTQCELLARVVAEKLLRRAIAQEQADRHRAGDF
jgi:hypothetical protein